MSKPLYSWSDDEAARAAAEGWYIWADTTAGSSKHVICPVESDPKLASDASAIGHVYAQAMQGSPLHQKALQLSLQTSPAFIPPRIGVNLTGGVVQSVFADSPAELMIIDYETDMSDDDMIVELPQDDGGTAEAFAVIHGVHVMPGEYDKYAPTIVAAERDRDESSTPSP